MAKRRKPVRREFIKFTAPFERFEAEFFNETRARCTLLGFSVPEMVAVRVTPTTLSLVAKSPASHFQSTVRVRMTPGCFDVFKAYLKG